MCIYIYMYKCMYIFIYVYVYVCMNNKICMGICIFLYLYLYLYRMSESLVSVSALVLMFIPTIIITISAHDFLVELQRSDCLSLRFDIWLNNCKLSKGLLLLKYKIFNEKEQDGNTL